MHKAAARIAKALGINSRAALRLLGSTTATESNVVSEEGLDRLAAGQEPEAGPCYRIGLGLDDSEIAAYLRDPRFVEGVVSAIQEYRSNCPVIYRWIISGNFSPDQPPQDVNRAGLKHATRTVGRLRAAILRRRPAV